MRKLKWIIPTWRCWFSFITFKTR